MYKEINLPEVVAALISDGVGEVRVNRVVWLILVGDILRWNLPRW